MHKKCCFTGHRPHYFPWQGQSSDPRQGKLLSALDQAVAQAVAQGYDYFIFGGASGADMWAAQG